MNATVTESRDRSAVFVPTVIGPLRFPNATRDAVIFETQETYYSLDNPALDFDVEVTRVEERETFDLSVRVVAATMETLLAWGRSIQRGEGNKVDIDI